MPKKPVEYHKVKRKDSIRFRVIIPRELNYGKRKCRYFRTAADAGSFATELNNKRGTGTEFLTQPVDVQEAVLRGVRTLGEQARRIDEAAVMFLHHLSRQPRSIATVDEVTGLCADAKEKAGLRPRYIGQLRHSFGRFCLKFGQRKINELAPWEIEDWLHGNAWAQATKRSYLTDIRTLFTFAIQRGYCSENMAERIDRPHYEDAPPPIWKVEEAKKVLKAAMKTDKGLIPYIGTCLFAGVRPSEAAALRKEDILASGYVQITADRAKTRKRRLVTILPVLAAWLKRAGALKLPITNLRKRLEAVREGARVDWAHDVMRHTFASYHLAMFGSAEKTALELGHSNTNTLFAHYRELVTYDDAKKFFALTPKPVTG